MKKCLFAAVAVAFLSVQAVPEATIDGLSVQNNRVVIDYSLTTAGDAIVTFDILTNGVSIGVANLTGGDVGTSAGITGDANVRVTGPTKGQIVWRPYRTWKDASVSSLKNVKAVIKAWSPFVPPAYMVVDLTKSGTEAVRYYESEAAIPGGSVLALDDYRTTKLVMKRIQAPADGTFMMFSKKWIRVDTLYKRPEQIAANNVMGMIVTDRHVAELADDYWMGVFELTQKQYETVMGAWPKCFFTNETCRAMRPVENLYPNEFRGKGWPETPDDTMFVGKLRSKTQLDFDQPTEAQWEYAACAGVNQGHYPDGSLYESDLAGTYDGCGAGRLNTHAMRFARMLGTTKYGKEQVSWSGSSNPDTGNIRNEIADGTWGTEDGTAAVGSYEPNNWGLYDVLGNVAEVCLDWVDFRYTDINKQGLGISAIRGVVNIDPDRWQYSLMQKMGIEDTTDTVEPYRVTRGGAWFQIAEDCHVANRSNWIYDRRGSATMELQRHARGIGYRLCCPVK